MEQDMKTKVKVWLGEKLESYEEIKLYTGGYKNLQFDKN